MPSAGVKVGRVAAVEKNLLREVRIESCFRSVAEYDYKARNVQFVSL